MRAIPSTRIYIDVEHGGVWGDTRGYKAYPERLQYSYKRYYTF